MSSETWGVEGVLPRDLCNGIESARGAGVPPEYYYWDGQILRARDGRYHMFMSTWSGADGFNPGWQGSDAFHAVSEQGVLGPYQREGYVYTNDGSHRGHNVSAVELPDGTYAVVVSETVPFTIYTSSSLDGPWTGCSPAIEVSSSNVSLFPRHDGRFQIVERYGNIAIADTLCGTYVKQRPTCSYPTDDADTIYPRRDSIPGVPSPTFDWQEDPHIWRSGGTYHVIYSGSGDRVGWHLYSADGINDWQDNGYAWSPREYARLFCFEGSTTCNQWYKMERPGVVLEDGHATHITWAVSDVDKDYQIPGNSNHGSKIIVVPFDGVAFDADFGDGSTGGTGGVSVVPDCPGSAADAYQQSPGTVPGTIEAEDFDPAGYYDTSAGNEGGAYRTDVDADIKALATGYAVGWMTAGEWLEYTVSVAAAGQYTLAVQAGAVDAGRTLEFSVCGTTLTEPVSVPQIAAWGELGTTTGVRVHLEAGLQVIRVTVGANDYVDFDSLTLTYIGSGTGGTGGSAGTGGAGGTGGTSGSGGTAGTAGLPAGAPGDDLEATEDTSGCGCRSGPVRGGSPLPAALTLLAVLVRRRRAGDRPPSKHRRAAASTSAASSTLLVL